MEAFGSNELAAVVTAFLEFNEALALRGTARPANAPVQAATLRRSAQVYVCGGSTGLRALRSVERLSPGCSSWEALPPMQQARIGAVGAAIAGRLYVCGGCDGLAGTVGVHNLKAAERFDPRLNRWEVLPDMLERRRGAVGVAIGERLYVSGGEGGADGEYVLSSAERYDPLLGAWEALPPMESHRFGAAGAAVKGCLCICGGSVGLDALSCVEFFRPELNQWETMPQMLEGRVGAAGASIRGCLYVCGGGQVDRVLRSMEFFRPEAGCWEAGPTLAEGFRFAAGVAVAGRLLVCGGQLANGRGRQSARRLGVERGQWEDLPLMSSLRTWSVALRVL